MPPSPSNSDLERRLESQSQFLADERTRKTLRDARWKAWRPWMPSLIFVVSLAVLGTTFYLLPRELGALRDKFFGRLFNRTHATGALAEGIGPARSRIPNQAFRVPAQAYFRAPAKKKDCPSWNGIPDLACLNESKKAE